MPHAHHCPIIIMFIIIIIIINNMDMMRRLTTIAWLGQYCSIGIGRLLCCTVGQAAWPPTRYNIDLEPLPPSLYVPERRHEYMPKAAPLVARVADCCYFVLCCCCCSTHERPGFGGSKEKEDIADCHWCCFIYMVWCCLLQELCRVASFAVVVLCFVFADRHDTWEAGIWGVTETTTATDSYNRPSTLKKNSNSLCSRFWGPRRKKSASSRANTSKTTAFIFISCFFDHVTSISSVRRRNRLLYARTFSLWRSTVWKWNQSDWVLTPYTSFCLLRTYK
jgi:hypothetical protein